MRKLDLLKMVLGGTLLLGGSSISFAKNDINLAIAQNQTLKKVDWSKIDTIPSVPVNNYPNATSDKFTQIALPNEKFKHNISYSQLKRLSLIKLFLMTDSLIPKLKDQLEDDLVDYTFHFVDGNDSDMINEKVNLTDDEVIKNFRLIVITRTNVAPDSHEYTFQKGLPAGYSIPVIIVPIVSESKEKIPSIVRLKPFLLDNPYYDMITKDFVKKQGGDWQANRYDSNTQKLIVYTMFPNQQLSAETKAKIENYLKPKMGVEVIVEVLKEKPTVKTFAIKK